MRREGGTLFGRVPDPLWGGRAATNWYRGWMLWLFVAPFVALTVNRSGRGRAEPVRR